MRMRLGRWFNPLSVHFNNVLITPAIRLTDSFPWVQGKGGMGSMRACAKASYVRNIKMFNSLRSNINILIDNTPIPALPPQAGEGASSPQRDFSLQAVIDALLIYK